MHVHGLGVRGEVGVSAVYNLPSVYFISFSLGTTKYCQ